MNGTIRAVVVTVFVVGLVVVPFRLREKSIAQLQRQYDEIAIGDAQETVQRRLRLRVHSGAPPERYRNDVWYATAGDRSKCRAWGVQHGQFLTSNHSLIVGFDAAQRVAFKAIGNT